MVFIRNFFYFLIDSMMLLLAKKSKFLTTTSVNGFYHANNLLCHDLTFLFWILETVSNHLKLLHFLFANEISMAQGSVQEVRKTNENNFGNFIW